MPRVTFEGDDKSVEADAKSLLVAALASGIPIANACGGAGKCSTCRVLVLDGECSPRTPEEEAMAERLGFAPEVRLACQARATCDARVRRLVVDAEDARLAEGESEESGGRLGEERRVAVLFCDIRRFTPFAEAHLPYDVVHVLNRWFQKAEAVIAAHGGFVDNFMGDAVMALFGLERPDTAAADAVRAGLGLIEAARQMHGYMDRAFRGGFQVGVGIHEGDVVLGAIGAGERRRLTAIGDAVNLAARIEAANKEAGTELLVSEQVLRALEGRAELGKKLEIPIRGKTGHYRLHEVRALLPED